MSKLIGNGPNQIPSNGDLGTMAFQDNKAVNIKGGNADLDTATISGVIEDNYIKLPSLTTTERNAVTGQNGMLIHNSTTGYVEQFLGDTGSGNGTWQAIATGPSVESISPTTFNGDSGTTITINGSAFDSGASVVFIGNDGTEYTASTVSFVSAAQLTATTPSDFTVANEPYDVKVINGSGLSALYEDALDAGGLPSWTTSAGTLGTFDADETVNVSVSATDPEGGDVDYTLTGTLPSGVSFSGETGAFTGTAPDIDNQTTYNLSVVPDDGVNNGSSRSFSITVNSGRDTYFNKTVLLLSGDNSLEDVTYPAFNDASGNDVEIASVVGQPKASPFSPYNTSWAADFDGSDNDYLTIAQDAAWQFGTGDFTVEYWDRHGEQYSTNYSTQVGTLDNGASPAGSWRFGTFTNSNNVTFAYHNGSGYQDVHFASGENLTDNTWRHFAVTRQSGVVRAFVNGVQVGSNQNITYNFNTAKSLKIGTERATPSYYSGNISNLRIVKGTALYTSNFTAPTSKLTAVSGTVLLTFQDNRFKDNSSNDFAMTPSGTPKTISGGPLTETDTTTGSISFDGTDDYITYNGTGTEFDFGSGEYTVEAWVKGPFGGGNTSSVVFNKSVGGATSNSSFYFGCGTNGISHYVTTSGTSWTDNTTWTDSSVNDGAWHHVVWQRSGNTIQIYMDGALKNQTAFSGTINTSTRDAQIGTQEGSSDFNGHISNLRVVKGSALYSDGYTVPDSPLTAVTNTTFLVAQTRGANRNTGVIESVQPSRYVSEFGNVSQSSFTPYGRRWSAYFGGDNDYVTWTGTALGSGDFTVEFWAMPDEARSNAPFHDGSNTIMIRQNTNGILIFDRVTGQSTSQTTGLTIGAWNHIVVTRVSGSIYAYINGSRVINAWSNSTNFTGTGYMVARFTNTGSSPTAFSGHISDMRQVKGTAVYGNPTTLSVPTTPLTAISGTEFLGFNSNRFKDSSSNNYTISISGDNTRIESDSPYFESESYNPTVHGGSAYLAGSGNYLRIDELANDDSVNFGTDDFTIEGWVYMRGIGTCCERFIAGGDRQDGANKLWFIGRYSTGDSLNFGYHNGSSYTETTSASTNGWTKYEWHHFAVCRSGSSVHMYWDGTRRQEWTSNGNFSLMTGQRGIVIGGRWQDGSIIEPTNSLLSDIRIIKGLARSTGSTITVPTEPMQVDDYDGTSLLMNFQNSGVFDSTSTHDVITKGAGSFITTSESKWGTGSIECNISADGHLQLPQHPNFRMVGDWTVEFWWKSLDASANDSTDGPYRRVIDFGGGNNVNALQFIIEPSGSSSYTANQGAIFPWDSTNQVPNTGSGTWDPDVCDGNWHHVAFVKQGTELRDYVDGTLYITRTVSATADWNRTTGSDNLHIGAYTGGTSGRAKGWLDDVRFTRGLARYTGSTYTVPTGPFKKR